MFTTVINAAVLATKDVSDKANEDFNNMLKVLRQVSAGKNLKYVDDHNGNEKVTAFPWKKFAILYQGRTTSLQVCPVMDNQVVCLNPLYIDVTSVNLSTSSIGGLVNNDRLADVTPELIARTESGEFVGYITL